MCFFFVRLLEYLCNTLYMRRDSIYFSKVKSGQKLLCMLLACVHSYLKSILRYKVLIVDTSDPDTLYSREH